MSARLLLILPLLLLALPAPGRAQGFAGLAADVPGFAQPEVARALAFPADHGPHPAFRIEWWYVTAVLTGADGQDYGVQWTLFRNGLRPGSGTGFGSPQVWMGHAAATSATAHRYAEKLARGGVGQAGVSAAPFRAFIDDWSMEGVDISDVKIAAHSADFSYDLHLLADLPLVLHGQNGVSVKSPDGRASRYYSQPFYRVEGSLMFDGETVEVTGRAWLDREWSSTPLAPDQTGWDWVSLYLEDGARVMGYRLRDAGGGAYTVGTWIAADGAATPLEDAEIVLTPLETAVAAGREVPVAWRIEVPGRALDVTLRALNPGAWMGTRIPYWEGPATLAGSHAGKAYLEMTGYE